MGVLGLVMKLLNPNLLYSSVFLSLPEKTWLRNRRTITSATFETRSWRMVQPTHGCSVLRFGSTELNGVVHWIARDDSKTGKSYILTFDLRAEAFGRIGVPYRRIHSTDQVDFLTKCDDEHLCFISFSYKAGGFLASIWVMREYGVVASWDQIRMVSPKTCPDRVLISVGYLSNVGEMVWDKDMTNDARLRVVWRIDHTHYNFEVGLSRKAEQIHGTVLV